MPGKNTDFTGDIDYDERILGMGSQSSIAIWAAVFEIAVPGLEGLRSSPPVITIKNNNLWACLVRSRDTAVGNHRVPQRLTSHCED